MRNSVAGVPRNSVKIKGKGYFLSGWINKTHKERGNDM